MSRRLTLRSFRQTADVESAAAAQSNVHLTRICQEILGQPTVPERLRHELAFLSHVLRDKAHNLAPMYLMEPVAHLAEEPGDNAYSDLMTAVAAAARVQDRNLCIDDIVEKICRAGQKEDLLRHKNTMQVMRLAVFALLGIVTMLFMASTTEVDSNLLIISNSDRKFQIHKGPADVLAGRRLSGLLKAFGDLLPLPQTASEENLDDTIHVARMTYDSLHHNGTITIHWTDALCSHLHLDLDKRILYLFRCPSFCVLNNDQESSQSVFHCVVSEYYHSFDKTMVGDSGTMTSVTLLNEVLRTYRLLFSDAASRKLFTTTLRDSAAIGGSVDPLLLQLCEKPPTLRDSTVPSHDYARETYHVRDDFALLGPRLLELQRHNNENPRTLRRILQDKQHPLETVNLKAVIAFGILSLLFSFLQVTIGLIQLVYSFKQGRS